VKTSNTVSENLRQAETGLAWVELLTNAQGTLKLKQSQTFRVRATGATTVTIDGLLAMTMSSGEIAIFNTGQGSPDDTSPYITVVIAGANAFVQLGADELRQRLQLNPYNNPKQLPVENPEEP
jgi:hypothetical protein